MVAVWKGGVPWGLCPHKGWRQAQKVLPIFGGGWSRRRRFEDANAAAESKLAAKKAELKAVQDNVRAPKVYNEWRWR